MLLRLDGGQSTLGQWALLGRLVEDKFLLIFVVLPTLQALLLRYLGHSGRAHLLLLALTATVAVLLHPLGIVFAGFSFAALLPFQLFKLRSPRERRTRLLRLGSLALLLVLGLFVPLLQRQQVAAANGDMVFTVRGQPMIDYLISLGLWVSPASDSFYALHPYLIGRRALLVLALLLLPVLLLVHHLRKPDVQWLGRR